MLNLLRSALVILGLALGSSALAQTTVTLAATADTWISASSPNANNGAGAALTIGDATQAGALVRFAIFQREGGPVPDNAVIVSSTLSLYKFNGPDGLFQAAPLQRDWRDGEATWNVSAAGSPWATPGGLSPFAGCSFGCPPDIFEGGDQAWGGNAGVDACAAAPFPDSCWVNIDVFSSLKMFSQFGVTNFGWRVGQTRSTGNTQTKDFYSKDNTTSPSLRPKLTVTYTMPVTVTLMLGLNGYAGATDDWINPNQPDVNNGANATLGLRSIGDAALLRFNIFQSENGPVPDGAEIVSATLSLYKFAGTDATVLAQQLLRPWNEVQATWNAAATGTAWSTPGAQGVNDAQGEGDGLASVGDAAANNCTSPPFAEACWVNLTVTNGVKIFAHDPTQNFGWRLSQIGSSNPTQYKLFNSKDNNNFPALRPKLTIAYALKEFASPKTPIAAADGETRPTFHSMSLYWNPQNPPPNCTTTDTSGCKIWVRYRKAADNPGAPGFAWKQGWPMWYDTRVSTTGWGALPYLSAGHSLPARGSVVYLTPGTKYVFELGTGADYPSAVFTHQLVGTTRSEVFSEGMFGLDMPPEPPTTIAPRAPADGPLVITEGGNPSTYKVYDGWNAATGTKNVIDRGGANKDSPNGDLHSDPTLNEDASFGIVVKASYVIIRRVVVKGAALSNIFIHPNVTDVVIEDSDISDWAWRPNPPQFQRAPAGEWPLVGRGSTGGVHLSGNNSRIVIQRNRVFDPHLGTSPWDFGHSEGPNGIHIDSGGMQNVIRYNEIYSTNPVGEEDKHWYNDGIGGGQNFSDTGSPGSDSDIYQNNIRNVMDDAIEAEGGGLNVRVWGNYIDHTMTGIAMTVAHFGPAYAFRNVVNRMRTFHTHRWGDNPRVTANGIADPDDDFVLDPNRPGSRGAGFKFYGASPDNLLPRWGGGRRYIFHNTMLQQPRGTYQPPQAYGDLGAGGGISSAADKNQGMRETVSRNNILHTWRPSTETNGGAGPVIDLGAGGTATNDFNYDLWIGAIAGGVEGTGGFDANAVQNRPIYSSAEVWKAFPQLSVAANQQPESVFGFGLGQAIGNFQLRAGGSTGLNYGQPLPNFSFDIDNRAFARRSGVQVQTGTCAARGDLACPDMGAHDSASQETMKFGVFAGP